MKTLLLMCSILGASLTACASTPAPRSPEPVETTSATAASREAYTPPGSWEMTIADKEPTAEAPKEPLPAYHGQADTTASKRQSGLINLPSKTPAKSTPK